MRSSRRLLPILALALLCGAMPAHAADHPHYLHALSELRAARFMLDRPAEYNTMRDQYRAIESIDHAIQEIDRAAFEDGKNLHDHPPPVGDLDHRGRLMRVEEVLTAADKDLRFEEDDRASLGWRNNALHHLADARNSVERATRDKRLDDHNH